MPPPLLCTFSLVLPHHCFFGRRPHPSPAHERSLQTDILFGVVKRAMDARRKPLANTDELDSNNAAEERNSTTSTTPVSDKDNQIFDAMKKRAKRLNSPPLRVVVMSATLDTSTFRTFFPSAESIQIPGRTFPVQVLYTREPQEDYIDSAISTVLQIHEEGEEGGEKLLYLLFSMFELDFSLFYV